MKRVADRNASLDEKRRSTRFASSWLAIAVVIVLLIAIGVSMRMYGFNPL